MNERELQSLIDYHLRRSNNQAVSPHQRHWAFETVLALRQLQKAAVPVEGTVR